MMGCILIFGMLQGALCRKSSQDDSNIWIFENEEDKIDKIENGK